MMGLSLRQITAAIVTHPILKVSTHKFLGFACLETYQTTTKKHGKIWKIKNTSGEALFWWGLWGHFFVKHRAMR
jgi:hypothetical protein